MIRLSKPDGNRYQKARSPLPESSITIGIIATKINTVSSILTEADRRLGGVPGAMPDNMEPSVGASPHVADSSALFIKAFRYVIAPLYRAWWMSCLSKAPPASAARRGLPVMRSSPTGLTQVFDSLPRATAPNRSKSHCLWLCAPRLASMPPSSAASGGGPFKWSPASNSPGGVRAGSQRRARST